MHQTFKHTECPNDPGHIIYKQSLCVSLIENQMAVALSDWKLQGNCRVRGTGDQPME